jgi:tetratricopeptide (TPR) repeat protein
LVVRSSVVAARFAGATPDLEQLAAETDVDAVLTGTLLRHGEELRASVQLVQAPEGTLIHSCTEQVRVKDLFRLQDDLVRRIVESLRIGVKQGNEQKLAKDVPKSPDAYQWFLRANPLSWEREKAPEARNLYLQCVQKDPGYAPAWAGLGRCYRIIAKYNEEPEANLRRAQSAFDRALSLNPELDVAHSQYALLESDLGRPRHAMVRLLERAARNPDSAELYAGLVYTCRFCGLMKESVWFHEEAQRLDQNLPTSVCQTFFQQGDYLKCMDTYSGDIGYIDALALDALGRRAEALICLKQRIGAGSRMPMARLYVGSLLALLEGRREESLSLTREACDRFYMGAEETLYMARQMIHLGDLDEGLRRLKQALKLGYAYPRWLATDPWLEPARSSPEFASLLALAEAEHEEALQVFNSARGDELLGRAALHEPALEAADTFTIPSSRQE